MDASSMRRRLASSVDESKLASNHFHQRVLRHADGTFCCSTLVHHMDHR